MAGARAGTRGFVVDAERRAAERLFEDGVAWCSLVFYSLPALLLHDPNTMPPSLCSMAGAPAAAAATSSCWSRLGRPSLIGTNSQSPRPPPRATTAALSSRAQAQSAAPAAAAAVPSPPQTLIATAARATAAAAAAAVVLVVTAPPAALAATTTYDAPDVARAASALADAFENRQYYVTGAIPPGLFADDCVFVDPTTRVQGTAKYSAVVASLFDASTSRADLISIGPGPQPRTVELRWRLEGRLALPGNPPVKAYTGSTLYVLSEGGAAAAGGGGAPLQVKEQIESWDISAFDAFASSFLPGWKGAPPAPPIEELLRQQKQQQ